MTLGHFIYIPGILLVGVIIGYVLGGRITTTYTLLEDGRISIDSTQEVSGTTTRGVVVRTYTTTGTLLWQQ